MQLFRRGLRRAIVAGSGAALVLTLTAGCTCGEEAGDAPTPTPLPSRSVGAEQTLEAKPVPTRVTLARVFGKKLPKRQRRGLDDKVTRVVSRYFDSAFLAGRYPRTSFPGAFDTFSPGAARRARGDRDLLSNSGVGAATEAVVPRVKAARLFVLAPNRNVVGLTARFRLVFVQERIEGADRRVTVAGRLLMQKNNAGAWRIFGYDVSRSFVPASKGASR